MLKDELERREAGKTARTAVARLEETSAVVGLATTGHDGTWPGTCVVDVFCHPSFWVCGHEVLAAVELPSADRYVAYCDVGWQEKETVLDAAGFARAARLDGWVAANRAKSRFVDVGVWTKR